MSKRVIVPETKWMEIRKQYETTRITFSRLSKDHDIADSSIRKRAHDEGWFKAVELQHMGERGQGLKPRGYRVLTVDQWIAEHRGEDSGVEETGIAVAVAVKPVEAQQRNVDALQSFIGERLLARLR